MTNQYEAPPFDPPCTQNPDQTTFRLQRGQYRGRYLSELTDTQLQNVWAGYTGTGDRVIAAILRAELDRRIANR